jgi:hypothetical protein
MAMLLIEKKLTRFTGRFCTERADFVIFALEIRPLGQLLLSSRLSVSETAIRLEDGSPISRVLQSLSGRCRPRLKLPWSTCLRTLYTEQCCNCFDDSYRCIDGKKPRVAPKVASRTDATRFHLVGT